MTHLFNSGRRCVPSLGSLALTSVRHAPAIYRKNVALTSSPPPCSGPEAFHRLRGLYHASFQ